MSTQKKKLKQTMQAVLQNCAQSLGLDLTQAPAKEVEVIKSDDEAPPAPKRARSLEPFPERGSAGMES